MPYDSRAGRFANDEGRVAPGLYAVGWARRGPSGTIGTNRPDGYAIVDRIAEDIGQGSRKKGREGFDALAEERGIDIVTFRDWQKIEEAEIAAGRRRIGVSLTSDCWNIRAPPARGFQGKIKGIHEIPTFVLLGLLT